MHVHTAGDREEYTLHVQNAGDREGGTHPARPHCRRWRAIQHACPHCRRWRGIHPARPRFDTPYTSTRKWVKRDTNTHHALPSLHCWRWKEKDLHVHTAGSHCKFWRKIHAAGGVKGHSLHVRRKLRNARKKASPASALYP